MVSEEKMLDMYVAVKNEQASIKGQRSAWPLVLIYEQCLIRLNISSKCNNFVFNSYGNMNF